MGMHLTQADLNKSCIENLEHRVTDLEARLNRQWPNVCVYTAHDELAEYSTACGQTVQRVDKFCKYCGGRTIVQGEEPPC